MKCRWLISVLEDYLKLYLYRLTYTKKVSTCVDMQILIEVCTRYSHNRKYYPMPKTFCFFVAKSGNLSLIYVYRFSRRLPLDILNSLVHVNYANVARIRTPVVHDIQIKAYIGEVVQGRSLQFYASVNYQSQGIFGYFFSQFLLLYSQKTNRPKFQMLKLQNNICITTIDFRTDRQAKDNQSILVLSQKHCRNLQILHQLWVCPFRVIFQEITQTKALPIKTQRGIISQPKLSTDKKRLIINYLWIRRQRQWRYGKDKPGDMIYDNHKIKYHEQLLR